MHSPTKRNHKGQSTITLGLVIAVFVLFAVGLFSFEINRLELAREQLQAATDSAALSAAATLASSNNINPATAQEQSIQTALTSFQQNSIVGVSLSDASLAGTSTDTPSPDGSSIYVELLNPNNNNQPVSIGDPNGKVVQITSTFGLEPAFGKFLGLHSLPIRAVSLGGVPTLDVVLCFDVSASIDDQTPVTFVRRQWSPTTAKIIYTVVSTRAGSPAGALAEGTIFNIIGPPAIGSAVDGLYPQTLSSSNTPSGNNQYPLSFSENGGMTPSAVGLRGKTNAGSPPGNYPPGTAGTGDAYTYTDLVVNIDGNTQFKGINYNGYDFPNLATLVEAARGNLESNALFTSSKANTSVTVTPKAGYQAAYLALAATNMHPIYDAQVAAQQFFTIMNTNTDAHFSLVAFTSNAGTSATDTYPYPNVDDSYSAAGNGEFPVPLIALNPAVGSTNYSQCTAVLPTLCAISGTNIGDAINQAVTQLNKNSRAGSKKAIVLFTDGEPTSAGPLDNSDPLMNARDAAVLAQKAGIPIYSIGLAQNPEIVPSETAILNDTDSSPTSGGVSGIAGNGGTFFLVTSVNDLQLTFENIARQLVQLVQ